jgi:hypothetical protein
MPTKMTFKKADLEKPIKVALLGISTSDDSNKGDGHILFREVNGAWQVDATSTGSGRTSSQALLTGVQVDGHDAFTVPGWRVEQWLNSVSHEDEDLTIDYKDSVSRLVSSRGVGRVASTDPANYVLSDDGMKQLKVIGTVKAKPLREAMGYARQFTSEEDSKTPALSLIEVRGGLLRSSDVGTFTFVEVPGFKDVTMRVYRKDIPALCSFLTNFEDDADVEVLESDQGQALRVDGYLLGAKKWPHPFPDLRLDRDEKAKCTITVKAKVLDDAVKYVTTFADKVDRTLLLTADNSTLYVSATSASGIGDVDTCDVPVIKQEGVVEMNTAYPKGFKIVRDALTRVLSHYGPDEDVSLEVGWRKNGWVRARHTVEGVDYFTLIVWASK